MRVTRMLRHGLVSLCLLLSLSGCATLRGMLTQPPAPPAQDVCPSPPAELFEPVPVPRACSEIKDNETLAECAEMCPSALGEANGKLIKARQQSRRE